MTEQLCPNQGEGPPPDAGEVAELVAKLRRLAAQNPLGTADPTITRIAELLQRQQPQPVGAITAAEAERLADEAGFTAVESDEDELRQTFVVWEATTAQLTAVVNAAIALDRSRQQPQPVPVSERPWEREGWCDEQGLCWLCGRGVGDWRLLHPLNSGVPQFKYYFSYSLPAHAIPQPTP